MALNGRTYLGDGSPGLIFAGRAAAGLMVLTGFVLASMAIVQSRKLQAKGLFLTALAGVGLNGLAIALTLNYVLFAPNAFERARHRDPLSATEEVGSGTFTNSVYSNPYLGFTITLPQAWTIQDQKTQHQLVAAANHTALAVGHKSAQGTSQVSEYQAVNLFGAYRHPPGSPPALDPGVVVMATRVRQLPQIKTGRDYLLLLKRVMQSNNLQVHLANDFETVNLGGIDFDVLLAEFPVENTTITRRIYVTVRNGYALTLMATHITDDDEQATQSVLRTITFQ